MCPVILRDQDATAGFLIQSVNYARSKSASNTAQVFDVMQQRIDERSRPNACARMNHHACRLVDDKEAIVFKQDLYRNVFGCQVDRLRLRLADDDRISTSHLLAGTTGFPIQRDVTRCD